MDENGRQPGPGHAEPRQGPSRQALPRTARFANRAMRGLYRLGRFDRPIGTWLLYLPGVWGILLARRPALPTLRLLALFLLGSLAMRAAGCVINDMWDRDIDRQVRRTRTRPLASGEVSMRQAALFLAALLCAALAVLLRLNPLAIGLGASSLLLVVLYPLAKRVTWWPQLVMGFTFGFGAPMGMAAGQGRLSLAMAPLYAAAIAWDLGFDTIYGFQDSEDDALIGVRSTSRRFAHAPRRFLGACYAAAILGLGLAGWAGGMRPLFWLLLPAPAAMLGWQVWRLEPADPKHCLVLFRANLWVGVAVALCLLAGRFA